MLTLLLACQSPACPEGQIRDKGGVCVDYVAEDPVEAEVWSPAPGTTWQIQFTGSLDTSVEAEMFDFDLFDTSDAVMSELQGMARICYFSAGSFEDWRDDAADFPDEALGDELDGWPGERWLDINNETVHEIMAARLDYAVSRGCDGVDPDNVDGYANDNGVGLTATEQLAYNRWLADEAHSRGLSIGLKNDLGQIPELLDWYDWALNEECVSYDECLLLAPFTDAEKAVFHIEYVENFADAAAMADEVCGEGPDLDTLIKTLELDEQRYSCE